MRRLWAASIWHPSRFNRGDPGRRERRLWYPLYDALAIAAGLWAVAFSSPIFHRLFPATLVDVAGSGMAAMGAVCLVGVVFPRLWALELTGKLGLVFLLGCYATVIALFPARPDQSAGFVVFILAMVVVLMLSRIDTITEHELAPRIAAWIRSPKVVAWLNRHWPKGGRPRWTQQR